MIHAEIIAPPVVGDAPARSGSRRRIALLLIGCWLCACLILTVIHWGDIQRLRYWDSDDQLRLLEVRDWLMGQSWWDVSQRRINPPAGTLMHWSRLIDLPLAAVILLLRPLLGYDGAQTVASVVVPLATLGFTMAMIALLTRRLLDRETAIMAALFVCATPNVLVQMRPLRVDHHGWQIGLALAALFALIGDRPLRAGLTTGAITALWLRISLEGLPLAASLAIIVGLRWAFDRGQAERARFAGFFASLGMLSAILFVATIPRSQWPLPWCDIISLPHVAMLATAGLGSLLLYRLPARALPRLVGGGALALVCLAVYHHMAPRCGVDPFADLDPLVRKIWFDSVPEGLPIWKQSLVSGTLAVGYPLVGLIGATFAWRASRSEARMRWACYLALLLAATAGTVLVQRISGAANALALPGGLYLLLRWLKRARGQTNMLKRVFGTAGAVLLFAPVTPALAAVMVDGLNTAARDNATADRPCATVGNLRALNLLPPSNLLAPLGIGPAILLETHHSVLATNHHRNRVGMVDEARIFMSADDEALRLIRAHAIRYLAICGSGAEFGIYAHYSPQGLAARLRNHRAPAWLTPVSVPGNDGIAVWRIAD